MNSPHSQLLAFGAASCIWRFQRLGCLRSGSMHPACTAALRCMQLLSPGAKEPALTLAAATKRVLAEKHAQGSNQSECRQRRAWGQQLH